MAKSVTVLDLLEKQPTSASPVAVLQATGLVAEGYAKFVLDNDYAGGVKDVLSALAVFQIGDVLVGNLAGATPADYLKASGLLARGYSKMVGSPPDYAAGVKHVVDALKVLGLVVSN